MKKIINILTLLFCLLVTTSMIFNNSFKHENLQIDVDFEKESEAESEESSKNTEFFKSPSKFEIYGIFSLFALFQMCLHFLKENFLEIPTSPPNYR